MKKKLVVLMAVLLILAVCGCGQQEETVVINIEAKPQDDKGSADAPRQAEQSAGLSAQTVVGRVDSIVGNEVTLTLGTVDSTGQERRSNENDNTGSPQADGMPSTEDRSGAPGGDMPGEMTEGAFPFEGMEMPQRGDREASNRPVGGNSRGGGNGEASASRVNVSYTGKTAVYLLPVGMAIGTGDFTTVSEGMVLQLSLNDEGTITAVSILSR